MVIGRHSGTAINIISTIERFLRYMRDHLGELPAIALHVEPTALIE